MTRKRTIAGRYELGEPIGRGGMATIYRAHDRQAGRDVAVKLMRPDLEDDPAFASRFTREAERAASISHPNVLTVYGHGTDGDRYIAMELVTGPDLATLLEREGPIAPERAVELAMQVAAALHAAHRRGIVHRDVKPSNLLLTDDGHIKVVDFGIARGPGETSVTATGSTLGSVDYFSPEQARGEPATEASDVYSLGIVLYEMLTGTRPFTGDSAYAVAVKRLGEDPADPRTIVPTLPSALVAIVMRALRRDPSKRYRSADGLRRALARWRTAERRLAQGPASAAPLPSRAESPTAATAVLEPAAPDRPAVLRPSPVARRRRRLAPLLGLAAVALLVVAGGALVGYQLLAAPGNEQPQLAGVGGEVTSPEPRGEVAAATPRATPRLTETPETSTPTPEPSAEPTPAATPAATPAPTPAPVAVVPAPGEPVAVATTTDPAQSVGQWYELVAAGSFDDAYGLWSERMRAGFDRQGNLDGRWDDTASITIHSMYVASQSGSRAAVQIDFTETKDSGSARRFVGWWELVLVDGRWLLDWPNF